MFGRGLGSGDVDDSFWQAWQKVRTEQQTEPLIEPVIRIWLCAEPSNPYIKQSLYRKNASILSHDKDVLKLKNYRNPMTKLHTLSNYKWALFKKGIKFRMIGGEPYDVTFFFVSAESYDEAKESLPPPMTWAQTCTIL
jgi:hypothetical protein